MLYTGVLKCWFDCIPYEKK